MVKTKIPAGLRKEKATMFFEKILKSVREYFEQDRQGGYTLSTKREFFEIASLLTLMRMAGEVVENLTAPVKAIAEEHVATIVVPDQEKCYHLLQIAQQFSALGELFGTNLLELVQPLLLAGLREFAEGKPIYYIIGPDRPESNADLREGALRFYCKVSHFAQVDVSSALPGWRDAIVRHLEKGRKPGDEEDQRRWQRDFEKEMAIIDRAIAGYQPLPNSMPL